MQISDLITKTIINKIYNLLYKQQSHIKISICRVDSHSFKVMQLDIVLKVVLLLKDKVIEQWKYKVDRLAST